MLYHDCIPVTQLILACPYGIPDEILVDIITVLLLNSTCGCASGFFE
jgi:hypothetical protein